VFRNRQARGIYFLDRPRMPSVIIETHHALDPREERAFVLPDTLDAFSASVAAGLVDFFSR
jgi:N-acetylmuramoyl-L-alanine amidase